MHDGVVSSSFFSSLLFSFLTLEPLMDLEVDWFCLSFVYLVYSLLFSSFHILLSPFSSLLCSPCLLLPYFDVICLAIPVCFCHFCAGHMYNLAYSPIAASYPLCIVSSLSLYLSPVHNTAFLLLR
ncbi:hypothetical protein P175DRAFT_021287 [Aspergillus ochraceoroseus IBT 24754]|uniref:Uncharacterized protein n=1 Tax=Aspergillus ochraceoroseus IBT 24754 TaxID=1392256 RepID=A0A2T5M6I7_9EURO|nr:uncharacterized protein P175DRAFT_021287 [Aspergillus ochraceoroseus IBT 24754]PTU24142.1 hypothetical protein P175DRAFT_021287 [Aspergillus ochraceoroseus IBT 24754]